MNPTFTKNYVAEGAIAPYRIIKRGTSDAGVAQGAAAADFVFGVTGELGAANGERIDVHQGGQPDVEYGGAVTRGDPLVSDANGMAVVAAPAAGANVRIIGFAAVSAVANDIAPMDYAPGVMQG